MLLGNQPAEVSMGVDAAAQEVMSQRLWKDASAQPIAIHMIF